MTMAGVDNCRRRPVLTSNGATQGARRHRFFLRDLSFWIPPRLLRVLVDRLVNNKRLGKVGGLFATGTVVSETLEEALLVPATALREADGTAYVLAVEGGVIRRRPVTVIARDPARGVVAVNGDLEAGETVIVAPTTDTVAGARVRTAGTAGTPARSTTDSE